MSRATISSDRSAEAEIVNLLPFDGEAYLFQEALPPNVADHAYAELLESIDWRQEYVQLFGRRLPAPRLTAWYGAHGYSYSGIHHKPAALTPLLAELTSAMEDLAGSSFNSVLVNLYRSGSDSMGWHSDDESALGPEPAIASLSLGAERLFHFRHREPRDKITVSLKHGSCLLMRGPCQACWQHQLPKTRRASGKRINLTFRRIEA
ncbi:MAG: alpha-ketoglutarate-dependent dioxygenase AlkB [Pseudomonadota bacterium]